jgi:hypothetical protein
MKDFTYRASDVDSKNTARENALSQVKILLLEEIGTYIESRFCDIQKECKSGKEQISTQEIYNLTAGITKTQILKEKWNIEAEALTFYISVKMTVDEDDLLKRLQEFKKERDKIRELQDEIDKLQSQLVQSEGEKVKLKQLVQIRDNELEKAKVREDKFDAIRQRAKESFRNLESEQRWQTSQQASELQTTPQTNDFRQVNRTCSDNCSSFNPRNFSFDPFVIYSPQKSDLVSTWAMGVTWEAVKYDPLLMGLAISYDTYSASTSGTSGQIIQSTWINTISNSAWTLTLNIPYIVLIDDTFSINTGIGYRMEEIKINGDTTSNNAGAASLTVIYKFNFEGDSKCGIKANYSRTFSAPYSDYGIVRISLGMYY